MEENPTSNRSPSTISTADGLQAPSDEVESATHFLSDPPVKAPTDSNEVGPLTASARLLSTPTVESVAGPVHGENTSRSQLVENLSGASFSDPVKPGMLVAHPSASSNPPGQTFLPGLNLPAPITNQQDSVKDIQTSLDKVKREINKLDDIAESTELTDAEQHDYDSFLVQKKNLTIKLRSLKAIHQKSSLTQPAKQQAAKGRAITFIMMPSAEFGPLEVVLLKVHDQSKNNVSGQEHTFKMHRRSYDRLSYEAIIICSGPIEYHYEAQTQSHGGYIAPQIKEKVDTRQLDEEEWNSGLTVMYDGLAVPFGINDLLPAIRKKVAEETENAIRDMLPRVKVDGEIFKIQTVGSLLSQIKDVQKCQKKLTKNDQKFAEALAEYSSSLLSVHETLVWKNSNSPRVQLSSLLYTLICCTKYLRPECYNENRARIRKFLKIMLVDKVWSNLTLRDISAWCCDVTSQDVYDVITQLRRPTDNENRWCSLLLYIDAIHYRDPVISENWKEPPWWGGLFVDQSQQRMANLPGVLGGWSSFARLLEELKSLLVVDAHLARTLVRLFSNGRHLTDENMELILDKIPTDLCLVLILWHGVDSTKRRPIQYEPSTELYQKILKSIETKSSQISEECNRELLVLSLTVATQLLMNENGVYFTTGPIPFTLSRINILLLELMKPEERAQYIHSVKDAFKKTFSRSPQVDTNSIELWKQLMEWISGYTKDISVKQEWLQLCAGCLEQLVNQMPHLDDDACHYILLNMAKLPKELVQVLVNKFLKDPGRYLNSHDINFTQKNTQQDFLQEMLIIYAETQLPECLAYKNEIQTIMNLCEHRLSPGTVKAMLEVCPDDSHVREVLNRIKEVIFLVVQRLKEGTINLTDFKCLDDEYIESFICQMGQVFSPDIPHMNKTIHSAIKKIREDYAQFQSMKERLHKFYKFCKSIDSGFAIPALDQALSGTDMTNIQARQLSTASSLFGDAIGPDYIQTAKEYDADYGRYGLFEKMFAKTLRTQAQRCTVNTVQAFRESVDDFNKTLSAARKGDMSMQKIQELKALYDLSDDFLYKQLKAHMPDRYAVCLPILRHLKRCQILSKKLLTVARVLDPSSCERQDEPIRRLSEMNPESTDIKSVDNYLKWYKELVCEEEEFKTATVCLDMYVECHEFVSWAHTKLQTGTQKSFIAVAQSSMEENHVSLTVSQLITALRVYSPFIHKLPKSARTLDIFQQWKSARDGFKDNPNAHICLANAAENLTKWKDLLSDEGADLQIMTEVVNINKHGKFDIGSLMDRTDGENDATWNSIPSNLNGVIAISVKATNIPAVNYTPMATDNTSTRSLEHLQERLTLLSVEKERTSSDDIRSFNRIKDIAYRLGKTYIDLRRSGCILFDDFKVCVNNNADHDGGEVFPLTILFKTPSKVITAPLENMDAQSIADQLHCFMTNCLSEWRNDLTEKRKKFSVLNYFTTNQIVRLRSVLGNINNDELSSQSMNLSTGEIDRVLALIQMVHTADYACLEQLRKEYHRAKIEETREVVGNERFVEIMSLGLSEDVAARAIVSCGPSLLDTEYLAWVDENPQLTREDLPDQILRESLSPEYGWLQQLTQIWNRFLHHTSSSLGQFLSLDELGYILNGVHSLNFKVNRPLLLSTDSSKLKPGKPNVIVCDTAHMMYKTLFTLLYEDGVPVPDRNQVLIYTPATSPQEIEVFMHRALQDDTRVHAMVNCNKMSGRHSSLLYEIYKSTPIRKRIQERIDGSASPNCCLLLLFNKENNAGEETYSLLQWFRNYQRQIDILTDNSGYRNLLAGVLTRDRFSTQQISATICDPCRYSARVVRSNVPGTGKSLYIRRLKEKNDVPPHNYVIIPIYKTVDVDYIVSRLTAECTVDKSKCNIIHFDIYSQVESGVDELIVNLILLGSLCSSRGVVWQQRKQDYYLFEATLSEETNNRHLLLDLLPNSLVCPPELEIMESSDKKPQSQMQFSLAPTPSSLGSSNLGSTNTGAGMVSSAYSHPTEKIAVIDEVKLRSEDWQIVLKTLLLLEENSEDILFEKADFVSDKQTATRLLVGACGLSNPTWANVDHFVEFLAFQLRCIQHSLHTKHEVNVHRQTYMFGFATKITTQKSSTPAFRRFMVEFCLKMAKDFTAITPDEFGAQRVNSNTEMQKHDQPYIMFNEDRNNFTFFGFRLKRDPKSSVYTYLHPISGNPIPDSSLLPKFPDSIQPIGQDLEQTKPFDNMDKSDKLSALSRIFTRNHHYYKDTLASEAIDPDVTYELTSDNAKKMVAIHQRIRVGTPVIIRGHTGCGKTRLIEYMCSLQVPDALRLRRGEEFTNDKICNIEKLKVHGGTTMEDIRKAIHKAKKRAKDNQRMSREYIMRKYPKEDSESDEKYQTKIDERVEPIYTVLFIDEANATELIGVMKEILCDKRMLGSQTLTDDLKSSNLKFIIACNPYCEIDEDIKLKLHKAGLGFLSEDDDTIDKHGKIPMRHLLYRVQFLPQSLTPLIWDFGMLDDAAEKEYIRKMVDTSQVFPGKYLDDLLSQTHSWLKKQKDVCRFVSLRDIERFITIMQWFDGLDILCEEMKAYPECAKDLHQIISKTPKMVTMILALAVCYITKLEAPSRKIYCNEVCTPSIRRIFPGERIGSDLVSKIINLAQDVFLDSALMGTTGDISKISRNSALKENVFMMAICMERQTPLYIIGKPGSSKSLAKTLVIEAMKGPVESSSKLFKKFKSVLAKTYQCSRLSTSEGIQGVFQAAAELQREQNNDQFSVVVVLEEVGLAEDSETMPLKSLHSLLEEGYVHPEKVPDKWCKCAFIGLSNWALDAAKMNRGIFLQLPDPTEDGLKLTARGMFSNTNDLVKATMEKLLPALIECYEYLRVKSLKDNGTEFYGLRDFYNLMKMLLTMAQYNLNRVGLHNGRLLLCRCHVKHAVLRNFSGFNEDCWKVFSSHPVLGALPMLGFHNVCLKSERMDLIEFSIHANLPELDVYRPYQRYPLLMVDNKNILGVLLEKLRADKLEPEVILGSYFRRDDPANQVHRGLSQIKSCMSRGIHIVLLNFDTLYESLYDMLNQYYTEWSGRRYADLGLGSGRLKAIIHPNFRLTIVETATRVHTKFPDPLLNRLEKHYLKSDFLVDQMNFQALLESISLWAKRFTNPEGHRDYFGSKKTPGDIFVGYSDEMIIMLGIQASSRKITDSDIIQYCKYQLLQTATPASVIRLARTELSNEATQLYEDYFNKQHHDSLLAYLLNFHHVECEKRSFVQATTFANVLKREQEEDLMESLTETNLEGDQPFLCLNINSIDTEAEFTSKLRTFFDRCKCRCTERNATDIDTTFTKKNQRYLLVQCEMAHLNTDLLAAVRFILLRESAVVFSRDGSTSPNVGCRCNLMVTLLLSLPKDVPFSGFQGSPWHCVHLDDPSNLRSNLSDYLKIKPSDILKMFLKSSQRADGEENEEEVTSTLGSCTLPSSQLSSSDAPEPLQMVSSKSSMASQSLNQDCNDAELRMNSSTAAILKQSMQQAVSFIEGHSDDSVKYLNLLYSNRAGAIGKIFEQARLILHHREQQRADRNEAWIRTNVATEKSMRKYHTLRSCLEKRLHDEICPSLTAVIAVCEPYKNLKIVAEEKAGWKIRLWENLFEYFVQKTDVFNDLAGGDELPEAVKLHEIAHKIPDFQCELPFSWLIRYELMRGDSSVGPLLAVIELERKHMDEIMQCYIHDYIHYKHTIQVPAEIEILKQRMRQLNKDLEPENLQDVHMCFDQIPPEELNLLSSVLNERKPSKDIVLENHEPIENAPAHLIAVNALIREYNTWNCDEVIRRSQEFCSESYKLCALFDQFTSSQLSWTESPYLNNRNILLARIIWLEELLLPIIVTPAKDSTPEYNVIKLSFRKFWNMLNNRDDMCDFHSKHTFKLILFQVGECLTLCNKKVFRRCQVQCDGCKEKLFQPWRCSDEQCNCVCRKCAERRSSCQKCNRKYQKCSTETQGQEGKTQDIHRNHQLRFQKLTLRLLREIVFYQPADDSLSLDGEIIEWLTDFIRGSAMWHIKDIPLMRDMVSYEDNTIQMVFQLFVKRDTSYLRHVTTNQDIAEHTSDLEEIIRFLNSCPDPKKKRPINVILIQSLKDELNDSVSGLTLDQFDELLTRTISQFENHNRRWQEHGAADLRYENMVYISITHLMVDTMIARAMKGDETYLSDFVEKYKPLDKITVSQLRYLLGRTFEQDRGPSNYNLLRQKTNLYNMMPQSYQSQLDNAEREVDDILEVDHNCDHNSMIECRYLWAYMPTHRIQTLSRIFKKCESESGCAIKVSLSYSLFNSASQLEALKELPALVELEKSLAHRYHNMSTTERMETITLPLDELLKQGTREHDLMTRLFKVCDLLKDVKGSYNGKPSDFTSLNWKTKLQAILPRKTQKHGLPLLIRLIKMLADIHNNFCFMNRQTKLDVEQVQTHDLVLMSSVDDLLPVFREHTRITTDGNAWRTRKETKDEIDWISVDRELTKRYLVGKRPISLDSIENLPKITLADEFEILHLINMSPSLQVDTEEQERRKLLAEISTRTIPELQHELDRLYILLVSCHNLSHVCYTDALLAGEYKKNFTRLPFWASENSTLKLSNLATVWLIFRFQQAMVFQQQKQIPFETEPPKFMAPLTKDDEEWIDAPDRASYDSGHTSKLLQDLFQFILLKLILPDGTLRPEEPLGKAMDNYFNGLGRYGEDEHGRLTRSDKPLGQERVPLLLNSQAITVWKMIYKVYVTKPTRPLPSADVPDQEEMDAICVDDKRLVRKVRKVRKFIQAQFNSLFN